MLTVRLQIGNLVAQSMAEYDGTVLDASHLEDAIASKVQFNADSKASEPWLRRGRGGSSGGSYQRHDDIILAGTKGQ